MIVEDMSKIEQNNMFEYGIYLKTDKIYLTTHFPLYFLFACLF